MRIVRPKRASRVPTGRLRAAWPFILLLLSGLTFSGTLLAAPAQGAPLEEPSLRDPHGTFVAEASQRFGVPEHWIRSVRRVESADDERALSSAGAMGLMQIMPNTWEELRARYGLGRDPYDPRDNILAGTAYLREMHDRYGSPGFLAAYNAGPGRYEEYLAGRPLPAETRAYVAKLAPLIGVGSNVPAALRNVVAAATDPDAWRGAALFIMPSTRSPNVDLPTPSAQSKNASAGIPVGDVPAILPPSSSLFVDRVNDGARP